MSRDNKTLTILFLTPAMGVGGVGRQLLELSKSLSDQGHEVRILSLTPIGTFGEKAKSAGISVESLNIDSKLLAPIAIWKVRRAIRSFNIDILHAHLFHAIIIGRVAGVGFDTPVVSTIHNTYDQNPKNHEKTIRDWFYSLTDGLSEITTFVSDAARDRFISVGAVSRKKSRTIYNGINTDLFKPVSDKNRINNDFTWISVGNLEEQKDISTLLCSVKIIYNDRTNFEVLIVGEGHLELELKQEAKELGIEDAVTFTGRVNNVAEYLNKADGFVLSSQWEGFGLVVAEAMACELPVVVTNTGGPSEIVINNRTGLISQKNSAEDLAEKMRQIMGMSEKEREKYGTRGKQRIKEKFDIDMIANQWSKLYKRVI